MNRWDDPIVTDVRRNREAILADFNGDIHRLIQYLKEQHSAMEASGWKAVTIKDVEANRALYKEIQDFAHWHLN